MEAHTILQTKHQKCILRQRFIYRFLKDCISESYVLNTCGSVTIQAFQLIKQRHVNFILQGLDFYNDNWTIFSTNVS